MRCPFISIKCYTFCSLILGRPTSFFKSKRGLRQGCPLAPLIFLLVAEGLSRALEEAKAMGDFLGITISPTLKVSHMLFVDDILFFCSGNRKDAEPLLKVLYFFGKETGMEINSRSLLYQLTTWIE